MQEFKSFGALIRKMCIFKIMNKNGSIFFKKSFYNILICVNEIIVLMLHLEHNICFLNELNFFISTILALAFVSDIFVPYKSLHLLF